VSEPNPQTEIAVDTEPPLLGVYLNDHFAGAMAGRELMRRIAGAHPTSPHAATMRRLADEVEADRRALRRVMDDLGVSVQRYKVVLAWVGERVGRAKSNGYLARRSPLSSLVELEAMRLGVEGKWALWTTLQRVAEREPRLDRAELDRLATGARAQTATLDELRLQAAEDLVQAR